MGEILHIVPQAADKWNSYTTCKRDLIVHRNASRAHSSIPYPRTYLTITHTHTHTHVHAHAHTHTHTHMNAHMNTLKMDILMIIMHAYSNNKKVDESRGILVQSHLEVTHTSAKCTIHKSKMNAYFKIATLANHSSVCAITIIPY